MSFLTWMEQGDDFAWQGRAKAAAFLGKIPFCRRLQPAGESNA
jgi:hypothetical protein